MLDKLDVPSVFKGKSTHMTMKDEIESNLNNLVNGVPIFKHSRENTDQKNPKGTSIFSGRK